MCKGIVLLLSVIFISTTASVFGNDNANNSLDGYIVDGQNNTLKLTDSNSGKAFMTFFDGFNYRLVISSKTTKKYEIKLFDIEKKILFSTTCDDYTKFIDLRFQSNMACYAEIIADGNNNINIFNITVGFKEISTLKQ